MRIDDFLNQSINSSALARKPRPADSASAAAPAPAPRQDTVTFSQAAQAFRDNNAKAPDRAPLTEYKALMDKMLGRGQITFGKSNAEKMKELTEEMRKLNNRLSEVMSEPSTPDSANTAKGITSQIKSLEARLAALAQEISEATNPAAAA